MSAPLAIPLYLPATQNEFSEAPFPFPFLPLVSALSR